MVGTGVGRPGRGRLPLGRGARHGRRVGGVAAGRAGGAAGARSARVWDGLAEAGFPWVGVPDTAGGSGGSLLDALAVLRGIGRHGAPVPMAETGLLAGWLLAGAGLEIPDGPLTVVPVPDAVSLD